MMARKLPRNTRQLSSKEFSSQILPCMVARKCPRNVSLPVRYSLWRHFLTIAVLFVMKTFPYILIFICSFYWVFDIPGAVWLKFPVCFWSHSRCVMLFSRPAPAPNFPVVLFIETRKILNLHACNGNLSHFTKRILVNPGGNPDYLIDLIVDSYRR